MTPDLPPIPPDAGPEAAIVAPAARESETITVESRGYRYVVRGNTLLPRDTVVASLLAGQTPNDALKALDEAYKKAGYILVALRAEVAGNLVAVRVFQGRIAEADIADSLAPYFAGIEDREDLDRNVLIRKTAMAETFAARQGMRPKISFSPAAEVGGSKITVTEEPIEGSKVWSAGLAFGNLGSRYSSRYVAQASGSLRPGSGLELSANYSQGLPTLSAESEGSSYHAWAVGGSVVTPWGLYGISYSDTRYRIGEVAAPLYPEGEITMAGINGTQLAYADEASRWTFTESVSRTMNSSTVFDGLFTVTDQDYYVASLATSFNTSIAVLGENAAVGASVTLSKGLSGRSGTFDPDGLGVPDPGFGLIQAGLNYRQSLPKGFSAGISWSGQWADATVPQNQQWVLGGFGNLSAWLPAALVGDGGNLVRATVSTPPWSWLDVSISGSAFAEGGTVHLKSPPAGIPSNRALGDLGLSLSGSIKPGTSLVLAYAWPIWSNNIERPEREKLGQANLYFSLSQAF